MRDIQQVSLILRDMDNATVKDILDSNYHIRIPRAEWSSLSQMLIIKRPHVEIRLPPKYLEQIIEGEMMTLGPEDTQLVMEWYELSRYRFFHQIHVLQKKAADARKRKDFVAAKQMKAEIRRLRKEERGIDFRQQKMKELAYYYNETGERIERLFDIMYSRVLYTDIHFGCLTASVKPKEYAKELTAHGFKESAGFFPDFERACEAIAPARTPAAYSPSAGILYNDEWAHATGYGAMEVDGEDVGVNCIIQKDTIRDFISMQIGTMPIALNAEKFASHLEIMLSDYALAKTEEVNLGGNIAREYYFGAYEKNMAFLYRGDNTFLFAGETDALKEDIPRILHIARSI